MLICVCMFLDVWVCRVIVHMLVCVDACVNTHIIDLCACVFSCVCMCLHLYMYVGLCLCLSVCVARASVSLRLHAFYFRVLI